MTRKSASKSFADLFARAKERPEYWIAGLEIEFTEELCRVMAEQGISRAELARRAGTSPAYITKVLRGSTNFTLATMAKLAHALGTEVRLHLAPRGSRTVWKDELSAPESWPEHSTVQRTLDTAGDGEGRPVGLSGGPSTETATLSVSVSSANLELKGDPAHEGSTDQVA